MVRLRKLDGTSVQVPAGTKAIPIQRTSAPASPEHDERIPMTADLRSAFDVLARPIEQYEGRLVMYEPTPGATELHEATVEGKQGSTAG